MSRKNLELICLNDLLVSFMESLMIAKFMQGILFQDLIYVELEIKTFGLVLEFEMNQTFCIHNFN